MTDAPERIWAWWDDEYDCGCFKKHGNAEYLPKLAAPYILATPAALSAAPEVQALVEAAVKRALEVAWSLGVDHTTEGPPANDWQEGNNYGVFSYRADIRAIAADPAEVRRIAEGRE